MINKKIEKMLLEDTSSMILDSKKTSMVFDDNSLAHAILLLNNVNYSSIPVLDYENKFKGLISNHNIMKFMHEKGISKLSDLNKFKVKEALDKRFYTVNENYSLEEVLSALIDYNFIVIIDYEGVFKGIITRSSILKRINFLVHDFDKRYILEKKQAISR